MCRFFANKITNYYINKQAIEADEKEVYLYCFELLISTIINLLTVLIISCATQLYIEGIVYSIVFMLVRGVGGGHHSKTHFTCWLTTAVIFSIYVVILKLVKVEVIFWMSIAFLAISALVISILAPVDTENKPLSIKEIKKNKIKTLLISSVLILIAVLLLIFDTTRYYSFAVTYPLIAVSLLLIIGYVENLKWKKNNSNFSVNDEN